MVAGVGVNEDETRPAAEDHVVVGVVGDVRDVDRLGDEDHIPRPRIAHRADERRTEVHDRTEIVVAGADVVSVVGPCADAHAGAPVRRRRERRPAHIVVIMPPGDPRRPPFVIRHPAPAHILGVHPAPVVIRHAAPVLVAHPRPAGVRVAPVSIGVRRPVFIHAIRTPALAVIADLQPLAVGRQRVVEELK